MAEQIDLDPLKRLTDLYTPLVFFCFCGNPFGLSTFLVEMPFFNCRGREMLQKTRSSQVEVCIALRQGSQRVLLGVVLCPRVSSYALAVSS